jgi:transposase-like protein
MANQSKRQSREELDRLVKEALEGKAVSVTKVDGKREDTCGKCGAPNRVTIPSGAGRVHYKCKECGHEQRTM